MHRFIIQELSCIDSTSSLERQQMLADFRCISMYTHWNTKMPSEQHQYFPVCYTKKVTNASKMLLFHCCLLFSQGICELQGLFSELRDPYKSVFLVDTVLLCMLLQAAASLTNLQVYRKIKHY